MDVLRHLVTVLAAGVLIAASAGPSVGPLKTLTTIHFGGASGLTSLITLPISVAIDRGYFKQHNIDLDVVVEGGDTLGCQATLSGSNEISECTTNSQLAADVKGGDLIQFDGEMQLTFPYQLVAAPSIANWAALKGQTIISAGEKTNATYFFDLMAKSHGYTHADFQYAYGGQTSSGRLAALKSGVAQATLISVPISLKAEETGYRILDSTFTTPGLAAEKFSGGGMETTRHWADEHKDVLAAYIQSIEEAIRWLYDPANKADVLAHLTKTYKLDSPALAEKVYAIAVGRRIYSTDLCTPPAAEAGAIQGAVAVGIVPPGDYPPEKFAPNSYVELANGRRCR